MTRPVFVVVGMMACFGSISRAPIAVMLMVAEMTGSLQVLAPAMLAVGLATLIVRRSDATIYRSQLRSRLDSPAHRLGFGLPLLASVTVSEVMAPLRVVLHSDEPVDEAVSRLGRSRSSRAHRSSTMPGVYLGIVTAHTLESSPSDDANAARRRTRRCHRPERPTRRLRRRRPRGARHHARDLGDRHRLRPTTPSGSSPRAR